MSLRPVVSFLVVLLVAAGCAAVRHTWLHPDYERVDRTQTLRLAVVTAPAPEGDARVGELWSLLARHYANQHRDFIVRETLVADAIDVEGVCALGFEGVLHLEPTEVRRTRRGYRLVVTARLHRCWDEEAIWESRARGRWASADPHLVEVTKRYTAELGEPVEAWVAPSFRLLRAALGALPRPKLETDDDVMEKIELGE